MCSYQISKGEICQGDIAGVSPLYKTLAYSPISHIPLISPLPPSLIYTPSVSLPPVLSTSDSEKNLPFLIHALVGAHKDRRSLASMHIHWLERFMAVWEHQASQQKQKQDSPSSPSCAYLHRLLWDTEMGIQSMADDFTGLHIPLPFPATTTVSMQWHDIPSSHQPKLLASLLHFTNYLFPTFTACSQAEVEGHTSLSPSQKAAIGYVNSFLFSRLVQGVQD